MAKQRKHYNSEEKVSMLRRRLLEGVALSSLCDELSLKPTVIYRPSFWGKTLRKRFPLAERIFRERRGGVWVSTPPGKVGEQHRIAALEQKLQRMNHLLAVLMEE